MGIHEPLARSVKTTSIETFGYLPGSDGAHAVQQWLSDRQAEGQLSNATLGNSSEKAFYTGKIETITVGHNGPTVDDTVAPDGTVLPTHGKPGQTIILSICIPHEKTVEYHYKWVPDANGGHWQLVETKSDEKASVACSA